MLSPDQFTPAPLSSAMMTDRYELTQLEAALADGTAAQPAVFELFTRSLPAGRGYGVVAGLERFLDALEHFTFSGAELDYLESAGVVGASTRAYLDGWRFSGSVTAYREGDLFFANSPVLTVESTFGDGLLLETLALSIFNHDSAVASAGARMHTAAAGRPLIEMGSRRTHEMAALAAARAAYLVGFEATSNVAAGFQFAIPTTGTSAHAFTLAHDSELDAFSSQISALGLGTTLLVDTYDIAAGTENAVLAARLAGGTGPGAIRIDSGDVALEATAARARLDRLGATQTQIVVTGDLDEDTIADLAGAPVDSYGVGTSVVTGSGHPTVGFVYKLVSIAALGQTSQHPVAKKSSGKATIGGLKTVWRDYSPEGTITGEFFAVDDEVHLDRVDAIQVRCVTKGERVRWASIDEVRTHHRRAKATLSSSDVSLAQSSPRISALHRPAS